MGGAPGAGLGLKHQNPRAKKRFPPRQSAGPPATSEGRSVVKLSPFESWPVVILYGDPLLAKKNGLTLNFNGSGKLVPIRKRCRTSAKLDGPHSDRKL